MQDEPEAGDDGRGGGRAAAAARGRRWLLPWPATRRVTLVLASFYLLSTAPAAVAGDPALVRAYWLASSLATATCVLWLHARGGPARAAAFALNAVSVAGNLLLAVSLAIQGTGFNAQFFYHVDVQTLLVAQGGAYVSFSVAGLAYTLLVSMWPALLPDASAPRAPPQMVRAAAVLVLGATLNVALLSLAWYVWGELVRHHRMVWVPKKLRAEVVAAGPAARDLVVVVAESLELSYSRADLVGANLTPGLTALSADAIRFADMRQVSHTGWTTAGIVAAFCAEPLAPGGYFTQRSPGADSGMPGAVCLGDVLAARGYRTVFMQGAALSFGGKETFLAAHGFVERLGLAALGPLVPAPYRNRWGLFDDSLLALARERLRQLAAGEAPFALVVLTLDMHPPGYPSASCGAHDDPGDRAFVIRCTDRLLASFIADARAEAPDAVIVLFSDHLSHESPRRQGFVSAGNPLDIGGGEILGWRDLHRAPHARRLRFAIWDPTRPAEVVDRAGTHFDIMPTVLDVLGMGEWREHRFGASLLRGSSPWLAHRAPDALQIVNDLPALRLEPGAEVSFHGQGPTIEIDGERILATGRGLALDDALFALAFAEDGTVAQVIHGDGFAKVAGAEVAPVVVGISSHQDTSRRLLLAAGQPHRLVPGLVFFAGRPGGPDFVAGAVPPSGTRTVQMHYAP